MCIAEDEDAEMVERGVGNEQNQIAPDHRLRHEAHRDVSPVSDETDGISKILGVRLANLAEQGRRFGQLLGGSARALLAMLPHGLDPFSHLGHRSESRPAKRPSAKDTSARSPLMNSCAPRNGRMNFFAPGSFLQQLGLLLGRQQQWPPSLGMLPKTISGARRLASHARESRCRCLRRDRG